MLLTGHVTTSVRSSAIYRGDAVQFDDPAISLAAPLLTRFAITLSLIRLHAQATRRYLR